MQLVNVLLRDDPATGPRQNETQGYARPATAGDVVRVLLDDEPLSETPVCEASVHLPRRSRVWQAAFTGPNGGQIWRSTRLTDRDQALLVARKWEAEARAQRTRSGRRTQKPIWRLRRSDRSRRSGFTQREVGLLLNMSERAVRQAERRAFEKLRNHPLLRQVWRQYLGGELDEDQPNLTLAEIQALFRVTRTPEERHLIEKIVRMIQP
jgi:hypothetical protein